MYMRAGVNMCVCVFFRGSYSEPSRSCSLQQPRVPLPLSCLPECHPQDAAVQVGASGDLGPIAQNLQQQLRIMCAGGSIPGSGVMVVGGGGVGDDDGDGTNIMDLSGLEYILGQVDENGNTRLHIACLEDPDSVCALLDLSADPCVRNNAGDTPLHCVRTAPLVDVMVHGGADISARNIDGCTPLHVAVKRGNVDVARALLVAGSDPSLRDNRGTSVLDHACLRQNEAMVHALLSVERVDVTSADKNGITALHLVEGKALVDALVDAGADVNAKDNGGRTALHFVCSKSNITVCALLHRKAEVNMVDDKMQTPLHRVSRGGDRPALVKFLLSKGANVHAQRYDGKTPLHLAVQWGRVATAKVFMDAGADPLLMSAGGTSSLTVAASYGHSRLVWEILKRGVDVNISDSIGQTPLHHSVYRNRVSASKVLLVAGADPTLRTASGRSVMDVASTHGRVQIVKILLQRGFDVTAVDYTLGHTPLHLAAKYGRLDVARLLLKAGADPLVRDNRERTPLDFAVKYGHQSLVSTFIATGIDVNNASATRMHTPLHFAVMEGFVKITKALVVAGANPDLRDSNEASSLDLAASKGNVDVVDIMIESGEADVTACDNEGWTSLHHSAKGGHEAVTISLIRAGADPMARNSSDASPLDVAVGFGQKSVVQLLLDSGADVAEVDGQGFTPLHLAECESIIDLLVHAGADVDAQTVYGSTPLMYHMVNVGLVRALLRHGARVNIQDSTGQTALHMASSETDVPAIVEVVDVLLKAGADETILDGDQRRAEDYFDGTSVYAEESRKLIRSAPRDRAWRRRGHLLMCMSLGCCVEDKAKSVEAWMVDAKEEVVGVFRMIVGYI